LSFDYCLNKLCKNDFNFLKPVKILYPKIILIHFLHFNTIYEYSFMGIFVYPVTLVYFVFNLTLSTIHPWTNGIQAEIKRKDAKVTKYAKIQRYSLS
jgi:hypothetical protein